MRQSSFQEHALWGSLKQLRDALDKADERSEPAGADALSSIRYLASALKSHQEPSDTAPYSKVTLDAINSNLSSVINEVTNYAGNGNLAHLTNAENHADQALHHLGLLPTSLLKGGAASQANRVFKEYRDDAVGAIKFLREQNAELRHESETARQDFNATVGALKSEIKELSGKIKQDEARLDQALTTNNDAFTAKQTEREEKFQAFLEKQGEGLKDLALTDLQSIERRAEEAQGRV